MKIPNFGSKLKADRAAHHQHAALPEHTSRHRHTKHHIVAVTASGGSAAVLLGQTSAPPVNYYNVWVRALSRHFFLSLGAQGGTGRHAVKRMLTVDSCCKWSTRWSDFCVSDTCARGSFSTLFAIYLMT